MDSLKLEYTCTFLCERAGCYRRFLKQLNTIISKSRDSTDITSIKFDLCELYNKYNEALDDIVATIDVYEDMKNNEHG